MKTAIINPMAYSMSLPFGDRIDADHRFGAA
jgi:hypothetical protein